VSEPLGPRNLDVRRLRDLLRRHDVREATGRFVLEGPRLLAAALDRGVSDLECFVDSEGERRWAAVMERARASGVRVRRLGVGVAERVADTVTSQGVLTSAPLKRHGGHLLDELPLDALVVVCTCVSDPGNAGTLLRSAEAAGAHAVVLGEGSVDAYNPKAVRASAGAVLGVPVAEGVNAVEILEALGRRGVKRVGAVAVSGEPYDSVDFRGPTALVLGHEARGLIDDLPLDALVTIPMSGRAESLNVAMAGTVLLFEVSRRRRTPGVAGHGGRRQ